MKLDFDDIQIMPATTTHFESRKNINVYKNGTLPIFTAPMDTVIDSTNYHLFIDDGVIPILPRTVKNIPENYGGWVSVSLSEFEKIIEGNIKGASILIDIANGHMEKLINLIKISKTKFGDDLQLMVGNIANPKTYKKLSLAGADFIRVGIGNGGACLTTKNTGVGYPMASLIKECYTIAKRLSKPAKIIADGGMKDYADIIKALVLGADYVMLGSIFNKSLESCGHTIDSSGDTVNQYNAETKQYFNDGGELFKEFRGMSTKEVQRVLGKDKPRTSEGINTTNKVEYTLSGWIENFRDNLATAMSYTDSANLTEFKKADIIEISMNSYKRFNK